MVQVYGQNRLRLNLINKNISIIKIISESEKIKEKSNSMPLNFSISSIPEVNMNPKEIYYTYIEDIKVNSPVPTEKWKSTSVINRINLVKSIMNEQEKSLLDVKLCNDDGYVYLELLQTVAASERGIMLLEFEFKLKDMLDQGLTVWHTPQGDKSSLRRLRGVGVKS